jgi:hypothetical protein
MKFSMTEQEIGDLLIEVNTWAGLYCILLICGVSIKYNKTWIVLETGEITLWCINKIQYRPAHVFTSIKRSPISCPVIENFI